MTASADPAAAGGTSRTRELAGALLVYLALAFLLTSSAWSDPTHRWIGRCCDPEQSMWFLAWLPTALGLGRPLIETDGVQLWRGLEP